MHRSPCSAGVPALESHLAGGSVTAMTPPAESTSLGTSRYRTMMRIASGGMGTVYLGFRPSAEGPAELVAIKRAHPHLAGDPRYQDLLRAEADCGMAVRHPNVVRVIDFESIDGELSLVMEYVEGATVSQVALGGRRFPVAVALRIALDLCAGLHAIHNATTRDGQPLALVHRDVSPQNAIVDVHGVARISDLGVARTANDDEGVLGKGLFGKRGYIAPECLTSGVATAASDVFALGVVIWEMLAGEPLFGAEYREAIPSLGHEAAALEPILARALAVDATARCTAAELHRAIESSGVAIAPPATVGSFIDCAASHPGAVRSAAAKATRAAEPLRSAAARAPARAPVILPAFRSVADALSTPTATLVPRCAPRSMSPLAMIRHLPATPGLTPLPFDVDRPTKAHVESARSKELSPKRGLGWRITKAASLGAFAMLVAWATIAVVRAADEPATSADGASKVVVVGM